jgi:hypothetical protein
VETLEEEELLLSLLQRNLIPLHDLLGCGNRLECHSNSQAAGDGGGVIAGLMLLLLQHWQGSCCDGLVDYMTKLHWQHV